MIRDITKNDIPFILTCMLEAHAESPVYGKIEPDYNKVRDTLYAMMSHGSVFGCLYPERGFMLGGVDIPWYSTQYEAFEMILYVRKKCRSSALGPQLVNRFEVMCKDRKAVRLTVGSSLGINDERAERMYEYLEYKWIGRNLVKEF